MKDEGDLLQASNGKNGRIELIDCEKAKGNCMEV